MEDTRLYRGRKIGLSNLSDFTQKWLKYYNLLDEALQSYVSFEPHDLKTALAKTYGKTDMVGINTPADLQVAGSDLTPQQSMYDQGTTRPVFIPNYWNNVPRINMANCYAHAMNVIVNPIHNRYFKLQPGEIYNRQIDYSSMPMKPYREIGAMIGALAITDISTQPNIFTGLTDIHLCQASSVAAHNQYKVALVAAPIAGTSDFFDYHWYKECFDGTWSHKPGRTAAVSADAGGRLIDSGNLPHQCNRTYASMTGIVDYSYFLEYFMVTHL